MIDIIIGALAVVYGIVTLIMRKCKPESFRKLETMKKAYGEKVGYAIHVVSYSVVPMLFGIVLLVGSLVFGISLFE